MEVFMGTIQPFGFNFAPKGWQQCNGQLLAIQQYSALFSLLGVNYGGDGVRTFGLPNLQGRTMIHQGQLAGGSTYVIGEMAGTEQVTILQSQMPAHTHLVTASSGTATTNTPGSTVTLAASDGSDPGTGNAVTVNVYGPAPGTPVPLSPTTLGIAGSGLPTPIMQPFLVVNVCIALSGIFPSRN